MLARSTIATGRRVEIVPVETRADMHRFIEFPYRHYRADRHWVAPLRSDQEEILNRSKHPFYAHADLQCFLALSGGETCGRIAGIIDYAYNSATSEKLGNFGFFESIDSEPVAAALLGSVAEWHATRGLTIMQGPFSPSINYESGLLIEGFDSSPCVMMTYNPPYYERLLVSAGVRKAMDLYAYRLTGETGQIAPLERARRVLSTAGARIRSARMDRFEDEVDTVGRLYNAMWSDNWGAAPVSQDEMHHLGQRLKPLLDPELVLFAEVDNEPVGFAIAVPDMNQALKRANGSLFPLGIFKILAFKSKIKMVRVLALGVTHQHRRSGIGAQLYLELIERGRALGYIEAECSWILENNRPMNTSLRLMGAERYKTYRIYESKVGDLLAANGSH
jgi:GNAT superfamily N-acetyltransferase